DERAQPRGRRLEFLRRMESPKYPRLRVARLRPLSDDEQVGVPLPTADALFAQEVEQKMSNLLAVFVAVQSFLDRTKHRTATQLAAAETSPGTSKIESNLPGWEDSNFDVMQAHRWVRRPQYGLRSGNSPGCREDYPPGRPRPPGLCHANPSSGDLSKR